MPFVCLGWGSLIWRPETLPVVGAWSADGPMLPLEFARKSRDGRITLVVCPDVPPSPTLWAPLSVSSLDAAKEALAAREGVTPRNIAYSIGWWAPTGASDHPAAETIGSWARDRALEGVVWTALKPRFGEDSRRPSEGDVIDHLAGLTGAAQDAARTYIQRAPRQIRTPFRTAIERVFGWTPDD